MPDILVLGAGVNGLTLAMLLAGDGHRVTVLERDGADPGGRDADELWHGWLRRGVSQFRQPHFLLPRWRAVMADELPAVLDEMVAMGALRANLLAMMPERMRGPLREGDESHELVTARRPVLEGALARVASATPGVRIRRGVAVTGLVTGPEAIAGVPHVAGVLTGAGETIRADLVVDATGRRSPVVGMLDAIGCRRPVEEREESGFVYYARHFRSPDGTRPESAGLVLQHFESVSLLTLPADSGTWATAFVASSRDKRLRALRTVPAWERALALFPAHAAWGEGEPIGDVQVIAGIEDRYRRFVVDGAPVVTGLVAVGDAWACTNPSLGRGVTIGLLHARALRDLLRTTGPDEPEKLARGFDETTEATITPLYRATLATDRHRLAEIDGEIGGEPYRTSDPAWLIGTAMYGLAHHDPDVLRGYMSIAELMATPEEVLADAALANKVFTAGLDLPRYPSPGPRRAELLAAVGA